MKNTIPPNLATKPTSASGASSLVRLLEWPTALSLGGLVAFIFSLKQVNPKLRFEWNAWSAVVFFAGTVGAWFLVRHVLRAAGRLAWFAILLVLSTVISFIYALKDISPGKRLDILVGAGSAFVFVAFALYGFWRLVQFLERHGLPEEEEYHDKKDGPPPTS